MSTIDLGSTVKVGRLSDPTSDNRFEGRFGFVKYVFHGAGQWPVGESKDDPLYIVKTLLGSDAFWTEELEVLDPA